MVYASPVQMGKRAAGLQRDPSFTQEEIDRAAEHPLWLTAKS
jgi:hypothetical protein